MSSAAVLRLAILLAVLSALPAFAASGIKTLSGANNYTNDTIITGGILQIGRLPPWFHAAAQGGRTLAMGGLHGLGMPQDRGWSMLCLRQT